MGKFGTFWLAFLLLLFTACNLGAGFASYQKPNRYRNPYYSKRFTLNSVDLECNKRYMRELSGDADKMENLQKEDYYVFYSNGYVLRNGYIPPTTNTTNLNYNKVFSEDVGNYRVKKDTLYLATKAGYQKRYKRDIAIIIKDTLIFFNIKSKEFDVRYIKH